MDIKKPSEQTVKDTIALAGGAFAGGMAGRAAFGFMHKPSGATDAAGMKKEENIVLVKQGVLMAVGTALAMFVHGKDSVTTLVKGAGIGLAINHGNEVVKILAGRAGVAREEVAPTVAAKAAARALGLGCPCVPNYPALNSPSYGVATYYDRSNMDDMRPASDNALEQWAGNSLMSA